MNMDAARNYIYTYILLLYNHTYYAAQTVIPYIFRAQK